MAKSPMVIIDRRFFIDKSRNMPVLSAPLDPLDWSVSPTSGSYTMTPDEIIEAMARAMQTHEWSNSAGSPPPFKADEQKYWMNSAKKAYAALTAKGLAIVPVEPTDTMIAVEG